MKLIFFISICLLCGFSGSAQYFEPYIEPDRTVRIAPVIGADSLRPRLPARLTLPLRKNRYTFVENPGVRYAIQNLQQERFRDPEVKQAINTLLNYATDQTLKSMVEYLQRYIRTIEKREAALELLKKEFLSDPEAESAVSPDIEMLTAYIGADTNYRWLKKISSDSALLELENSADRSIRFWINNGQTHYHRFWPVTRDGDSIGTWVQVAPGGNRIRLLIDDDVQASRIRVKSVSSSKLEPRSLKDPFNARKYSLDRLHRRYWTYHTEVDFSMGQGYVANWSGGGENSLSMLSNLRYFLNYNKNKISWENFVYYRLSFLKSGDQSLRKNDERFEINSKLGQQAFKHWFYTAQLNIQTTLFNSYEYSGESKKIVGNFMTPLYVTPSVGIDYKPSNHFSLYLSPIAGKWTYLRDTTGIDPARYGVERKRHKLDAGAKVELRNTFSIKKIVNIRNELLLFSSYGNTQQKFNANWNVQVNFRINYFMQTSIYTYTVFDKNYSKKLQFKENLNIGVNFRF
ncbi:MAG: DUF3078 domain-containing protein [Culturomica sp.]|jgi:hypothetical protein|nr:DUF3078 domain-containing protein [Culturomica sp.]